LHQNEAEQKDNAPTKSVLQSALQDQTLLIIDSYLRVWAGFVRLGEDGDGCKQVVVEAADWWLVWSLSDSELARDAYDWAARGNPWPFSRIMHSWFCLQVFLALKRNKVLNLTRLEAANRLVRRWNPFPFDKKLQALWKKLPHKRKKELRDFRNIWVIEACEELAEKPRPWRFDRRWLKDAAGHRVECKVEELPLPKSVKALRNSVRNKLEAAILEFFNTRSFRDSDSAKSGIVRRDHRDVFIQDEAASVLDNPKAADDSADVVLDDSLELTDTLHREQRELELLEHCPIFTRRRRELISRLRRQHPYGQRINVSAAAREMGIKPQTGWVHWHNIKKKRTRARIWLRTRKQ
jgi:hypothetical protein